MPQTIQSERLVLDHRRAALARRITATPAVLAVIADHCWPVRDGAAAIIQTAPLTSEARP